MHLVQTMRRHLVAVLALLLPLPLSAQTASELAAVRAAAHPVTGAFGDYDALVDAAGNAHLVFLGEMTHGTAEFYDERARISRRLIVEKGFRAVAIEADFRDVARVNAFILGRGGDAGVQGALSGFTDFPQWMWRNAQFANFVLWLRQYNASATADAPVRIVGMDLQNPISSVDALVAYLGAVDADAAARARQRYSCFDPYRADMLLYAGTAAVNPGGVCREAAVAEFDEIEARYGDGGGDDALFDALQDARVVMNGEAYYRALGGGPVSSWIIRDQHFLDTLAGVRARYAASVAIWTHNSHAGDARATDGVEPNVSEFARDRFPGETYLVGFLTYAGTVMASHDWNEPAHAQPLLPARSGSDAALLHAASPADYYLLAGDARVQPVLQAVRLQRAVGVVYRPETELQSHYFSAAVSPQFDAVVYLDITRAVDLDLPAYIARRRAAR